MVTTSVGTGYLLGGLGLALATGIAAILIDAGVVLVVRRPRINLLVADGAEAPRRYLFALMVAIGGGVMALLLALATSDRVVTPLVVGLGAFTVAGLVSLAVLRHRAQSRE